MLSEENCRDILTYAKLQPNSFYKINQTILFDDDFNNEGCCIFKVNNEIMNSLNLEDDGEPVSFSIKGNNNDTAVLCTKNKSYNIIESETSNTILVLPNIEMKFNDTNENESFLAKTIPVSSICNKLYEVALRKAKIGEVYKILRNSIYYHHIEDEIINKQLYNFQSLLNVVMMSEQELKTILEKLKVYQINGMLRMLNIDYVYDIVLKILECSFENDFSIWNLSQSNVHAMLDELFPSEILNQTLQFYFEKLSNNESENDVFWKVNELEVTRCFAEQILTSSENLELEKFLTLWNKNLPEELKGDVNNLRGLAIVDENNKPATIQLLKSTMLPDESEARFTELFSRKSHWKQDELEGFVYDIVPENSTASQFIMKFCRCTNSANIKTFSKR